MIYVKNLNKHFNGDKNKYSVDENKGISDFTYHFEKGNVYGLIGPNGAGKTTLIKLLVNFIHKESGSIEKHFEKNERLHNISYMPDFNMLLSGTVERNIEFFNLSYDDLDRELLDRLLQKFELNLKDKTNQLSTGKVKALRFALCISRKAKVYILDEPFSGIDVITRKMIMDEIVSEIDIAESLVIVSSHELHDMDQLLDQVLLIDHSRLIRDVSVEKIREESNQSLYEWFITEVEKERG